MIGFRLRRRSIIESARRHRDLYAALFESTAVGICIVDSQRRILDCNDEFCSILQRPKDDLVGRTGEELTAEGEDPLQRRMAGLVYGEIDRYTVEKRYIRGDGSHVWARVTASAISRQDDLYVAVVVDLTEREEAERQRKAADDELRAQRELLQRAQDAARIGSYSLDVAQRSVVVSRELARVLAAGEEQFETSAGRFSKEFIHEDDVMTHAVVAARAYREGGHHSFESRMRRRDGQVIWTRVHGTVELDALGLPERVIGFVQDVSDEHALEEQLRQAQKVDAVGQLAGGVAHDFNNLLTVIAGNAQLTLIEDCGEAVEESTREILRATERASELVRQLLAFSRAESDDPGVLDLNAVIRGVRRMLDRLLEENIEIVFDLAHDDAAVLVDRSQMEQILLNLAVNARDAMPGGGRLTVSTRVDDASVRLVVRDDGVGMDEQTGARIFDPFFTTKPRGVGTGLGLSTVYRLVTKAGGSIAVDSRPGEGAAFELTLPRVHTIADPEQASVQPMLTQGGGESILIVEDEPMVRAIAAEILARAGYVTSVAENGEEALRMFEDGASFDLLVSDLMMPKLTGPELAERLRQRGRAVPTVFMSGYPAGVGREPADDTSSAFVAKPFTGEALTEAVRRQLDLAA